ncbi:CU044_5270 family protein [Streptomyces sp. TX20-6-3]|uniref:CU044_5270 family protein n=1 Tax=Streptomyces sp. TX20-6-3 TaxID=3028705 RepID=UPI0029B7D661|nr:CU044_5270 family protein [Streptomyces sp. TX20-6-3]MDX2565317.1 CU044_5270 family protein [Streptomyces sp. TX20-6-3]
MSPKPPRPTPAERMEMAQLLQAPAERDLTGRRHQLLKDCLMREIQHASAATAAPRSRPSRKWALTAAPLAAGAIALGLLVGGGGAQVPADNQAETAPASMLLDRIATVAASKTAPVVGDDQYIRITSTVAYSRQTDQGPVMRLGKLHQRQVWLSADGSRHGLLRERGEECRLEAQRADPGTEPSLNAPTHRYLESLPTSPDTLLKKIYDETKGGGSGPDQEAFVTIGDLLREQFTPPKISAALYKAAAKIPGVTVVNDAADAAGRHGVAIARAHNGERTEWIFDTRTLEFLGERSVMLKDTAWAKKNQITATTAVLDRTVTNKPGQTASRSS